MTGELEHGATIAVSAKTMKIALTGDVMLGRLVDEYVIGNPRATSRCIWGELLPSLLEADARIINLECVISDLGSPWKPESKAFHFRASKRAIEFLKTAQIDVVTLANNHVLDFGSAALDECLHLLDAAGIKHAGAGRNIFESLQPAVIEKANCRIAVVALTDNEPEWEATATEPGTNFVAHQNGLLPPYFQRVREAIANARSRADIVIVSAHVGPNWGAPSMPMRTLARQLIDLGADLYWGHSNHACQGIERYGGKLILYSTGDFLDDYAVDPLERNDLSFLFEITADSRGIKSVRLLPCAIDDFCVWRASAAESDFLRNRMKRLCRQLGCEAMCDVNGVIEIAA